MRTRDLCQESTEFAVSARLFKPYVKTGRYVASPRTRSTHAVDDEIKVIAHYSSLEGALYGDERAWKRAHRFISTFTRKESGRLNRRWWALPRLFGPIDDIAPPDVLAQLDAALVRLGFQVVDRNDRTFTAMFTAADACLVADLPEPFGKWCQVVEGKPRWKQEIDLGIDVKCEVSSEDASGRGPDAFSSFVSFQVSSLAAPLFLALESELASLLHVEGLTGAGGHGELTRRLISSLRSEIDAF